MSENDDELQLRSILQADCGRISEGARLPTAQQALWRAKLRIARTQRRGAATLVSFIEAAAGGILTLVLLGLVWSDLAASPAENHRVTLAVSGLVTILAFAILVLVPLYTRPDNPFE